MIIETRQWHLKIKRTEPGGKIKSVVLQCGQDEQKCRDKAKQVKSQYKDLVEIDVFYGTLSERDGNN